MTASRVVLIVGLALISFALGVTIEEKIDGDSVGALPVAIAIGGGMLGAFGAWVEAKEKRAKESDR